MPTATEQATAALILASGSPYRRELLARVFANFAAISPDIDERPRSGEAPHELAGRLAKTKALAIAELHPAATVIGSDQVADLRNQALGKPGNQAKAIEQLLACSGRSVRFHTAVYVMNRQSGFAETHIDVTTVKFRSLSHLEIEAYVRADQPWDCAGSFRSEGLGVALLEAIDNRDPTAIIGLPMIWLTACLRRAGIPLLET